MTIWLMRFRVNIVAEEKQQISHILSVGVCVFVDLVMQHAVHMRRIIRDVSGSAIIFRISDKQYDFLEKAVEHNLCILIFCTTSV